MVMRQASRYSIGDMPIARRKRSKNAERESAAVFASCAAVQARAGRWPRSYAHGAGGADLRTDGQRSDHSAGTARRLYFAPTAEVPQRPGRKGFAAVANRCLRRVVQSCHGRPGAALGGRHSGRCHRHQEAAAVVRAIRAAGVRTAGRELRSTVSFIHLRIQARSGSFSTDPAGFASGSMSVSPGGTCMRRLVSRLVLDHPTSWFDREATISSSRPNFGWPLRSGRQGLPNAVLRAIGALWR